MRYSFLPLMLLICFIAITFVKTSRVYAEEVTVLMSQNISVYREALKGFRKIYTGTVKEYDFKGDPKEANRLLLEVKKHPGDLVVSIGLLATEAARENIKRTPMLFCMVYYPERFSFFSQEMTGIRLDVPLPKIFSEISRLFTNIKRVGVLYDPKKTGKIIDESREIAMGTGISLIPVTVESEKELPDKLRSLSGNIDLLWMIPDSTVVTPIALNTILLTSFKNNIPIMSFSQEFVEKGAIAALSLDNEAVGEEIGDIALKIIQGDFPSTFPIHSILKTHLSVNLKMARKMGIRLNPEEVRKAVKVYE